MNEDQQRADAQPSTDWASDIGIAIAVAPFAVVACAVLIGCSSETPPAACQSNDRVLAAIASSTDGGSSKVVWMAGETQGWAFTNVGANATLRKKGFADGDLLAQVCGLTIDEFVNAQGEVCCKGLVLSFRGAGGSYDVTLEQAP